MDFFGFGPAFPAFVFGSFQSLRGAAGFSLFRRSLQPERIEYCRAELLPDCLVGSLAVPDKTHPLHLAFSLAFYLDRGQLILAADEQTLPALQSLLFPKNRSILPMSSTCFSRFWNR